MSDALEHLELANAAKLERAELRRRVRTGEIELADLIETPPSVLVHKLIANVIVWAPSWANRKLSRLNHRAMLVGVNLLCELGEMAPRNRAWLVAFLRYQRHTKAWPTGGLPKPKPLPRYLPVEPFARFLEQELDCDRVTVGWVERTGLPDRQLRSVLKREYETVNVDVIDRVLTVQFGRPDLLDELYPELGV